MTPTGTHPHARRITLIAAALAVLAAALLPAAAAKAQDDYLSRANALYRAHPQNKRSDLVILPAIAAMDEAPAVATEGANAILMTPQSRSWPEIEAWLMAPAQRAALEALATVTADEGPTTHMVFAQPYGYEGVPVELIMAELYTDLGDPPSLAAADFLYLDGIKALRALVHLEANRLVASGEGREALELMLRWVFFSRQIVDRELAPEKFAGLTMLMTALEHMRDLAYQDFTSQTRSLTPQIIAGIVGRLSERESPLGIERILLPRADQFAVEQLLHRIYDQRTRRPDPAMYSAVMARVSTQDRPLRLFSEAAKWDAARNAAADWFAITEALRNVAYDFDRRWGLAFRDPVMALPTDFETKIRGKAGLAPLELRYRYYPQFFKLRQDLRVEAGGTRTSLAMYAYFLQHRQFPLAVTAVRPNFVRAVDIDPYSPEDRDLSFFVPIRDQPKGPRGEPAPPHETRVFPAGVYAATGMAQNFAVRLRDDQFVIYSVGPNETRGWARDATQGQEEYRQGDYLLWPPVTSLLRTHLNQQGR